MSKLESNMKYSTLEGYGVLLKRLTEDKIELIRNWRNDPKISKYMEFRDYITPEMQLKWFKKIDNDCNFYFIIEVDGNEIGLVNVRDVDYQKKEGEGGIFIYDDSYLNSMVSFQTALILNDFCFEKLGLERMVAHIMSDNKRAIDYNKHQGYKIQPNQEGIMNQLYYLSRTDYFEKRKKIARLF